IVGAALGQLVDINFGSKNNKDVCVVSVQKSPSPIWTNKDGNNYLYLRSGNQTKPLDNKETAEYIKIRWPQKVLI
ncbi:hypothetical protein LCGC14_2746480, partial [marine sediment metagenome]